MTALADHMLARETDPARIAELREWLELEPRQASGDLDAEALVVEVRVTARILREP